MGEKPANRKYEFTGETLVDGETTFRRIRAVRDFGWVKAGDLGGWLESEDNLSHSGICWVTGNARAYGDAWIFESARVCESARVYGSARVSGWATVRGSARVSSTPPTATRSDGYAFLIAPDVDRALRIVTVCRYFTIPEARGHWTATRGGTPLGEESLAIVDHLERMARIVGLDGASPRRPDGRKRPSRLVGAENGDE